MKLSTRAVGQFIRANSGVLYLVSDGKKQRISSWAHFATLRGDGPGYIQATNYFANSIPFAGTAPANVQLSSLEGIPSGDFGELTFEGTIPEVVEQEAAPAPGPAPAPSSTPASTPEPEPAASQQQEYRVVSGDTLSKIASKFGVSTSLLQSFSKISNPNLIHIGQLILIPGVTASAPAVEPKPTPAPTPEPVVPPVDVEYQVKSGDTLLRIAYKFGISTAALQSYNSITNPNRISIGQSLKIPTGTSNTNVEQAQPQPEPAAPATYKVVAGDTLWGIARKLGVKSSALASLNGINNANFIRVGQVLKVPN